MARPEIPSMDLASRLKAWRLANNLTQAQAAAKVGSAHPSWNDWEHGKKRPSAGKAFALEALTGIPARAWFTADDVPHAAPSGEPETCRDEPPAADAEAAQ